MHAFLEQQRRRKSQRKIKGVLVKVLGAVVFLLFIVIYFFLNNFQFKSQNKVSSILGRSLRLIVYDFEFNSILLFLVKFSILSPNLIISANQGFRRFFIVLGFYFLNIYMFCSRQRQIKLLSIKIQTFVKLFLQWIQIYLLVDLGKPLVDSRFITRS